MARTGARPRVVIVTSCWGESIDEATAATRLIAGALATLGEVHVIHVVTPPGEEVTVADSVFTVHRVSCRGARPLRSSLLRTALASAPGRGIATPGAALLEEYEGNAPAVVELVGRLRPDAVLLAGDHQPFDLDALREQARGARLAVVPYCADRSRLRLSAVRALLGAADAIGTAHAGEAAAIAEICPERKDALVPLDLALPINRSAAAQGLFGVRFFGSYLLLIRSFPPGGPRFSRSVTHEVLRSVLDRVSVAEVDGNKWRISDRKNTLELPVNPSRVNLWRLMAHGLATVDVRPPGPIGREVIESMLFGTPAVALESSAGMQHIQAANGGLWYSDAGELFDGVRAIVGVPQLRAALGAQGRAYALSHHGQMDDFVRRTGILVLGADAPARAV